MPTGRVQVCSTYACPTLLDWVLLASGGSHFSQTAKPCKTPCMVIDGRHPAISLVTAILYSHCLQLLVSTAQVVSHSW